MEGFRNSSQIIWNEDDPTIIEYNKCTTYDDQNNGPWCAVDVDERNVYRPLGYGLCQPECDGESPQPDSKHNLGKGYGQVSN